MCCIFFNPFSLLHNWVFPGLAAQPFFCLPPTARAKETLPKRSLCPPSHRGSVSADPPGVPKRGASPHSSCPPRGRGKLLGPFSLWAARICFKGFEFAKRAMFLEGGEHTGPRGLSVKCPFGEPEPGDPVGAAPRPEPLRSAWRGSVPVWGPGVCSPPPPRTPPRRAARPPPPVPAPPRSWAVAPPPHNSRSAASPRAGIRPRASPPPLTVGHGPGSCPPESPCLRPLTLQTGRQGSLLRAGSGRRRPLAPAGSPTPRGLLFLPRRDYFRGGVGSGGAHGMAAAAARLR